MKNIPSLRPLFVSGCLLVAFIIGSSAVFAQDNASKERQTYDQIRAFALTGGSAQVNALVLKKDRTQITLTGTVYLGAPVNGVTPGAVCPGWCHPRYRYLKWHRPRHNDVGFLS